MQLHVALPQPQELPVAVLAGNFRELTVHDGAEASSSHAHAAESEARGSSSTSGAKKRREKKKNPRITRVSPRPIIRKAKRRKDMSSIRASVQIVFFNHIR